MKKKALIIVLLMAAVGLKAQDYQWQVEIKDHINQKTGGHPHAYLWIPEHCEKLRSVIFSQENMTEEEIFRNENFLNTLRDLNIGIVWVSPSFDYMWKVNEGSDKKFTTMMDDLADISGYTELATLPVIPLGHSAMATFPWNFAAFTPERTLAIISYKGDAPRTNLCGYGGENVEWGRTRNIDGIPGLMIEGEWEFLEERVTPALSFKMKYPGSCISFLCDTGHGHFDFSDELSDYICLFLRKVMQYRLKGDSLVALKPENGWLADRFHPEYGGALMPVKINNVQPRQKAAPYYNYKGDKHDAFWYFDEEMAKATEDYYKRTIGKKCDFIGYTQDGKLLGFNPKLHTGTIITPHFHDDGVTFNIAASYTDITRSHPSESHSLSKIHISVINGPVRQLDDTTFQICKYRIDEYGNKKDCDVTLQALSNPDRYYKGAAQQMEIVFPIRNTEGIRQSIAFPTLQDITPDVRKVPLRATADSGLPVRYYVVYGPAHVEGNELVIDDIPPRAKLPVEVKVVAWQYGIKGKIQSADNVARTFNIL